MSSTAHPRVEQRVHDVDDRVHEHDEEGGVHDCRENHGQVEVLQRVERQLADPVQPEHDLRQQGAAADESAEVEAEEEEPEEKTKEKE